MQEFFKQSDAEKLEGLPVTPFMDRDKITKPSSQCSFIGFVLLPLFEALGALLPELQVSQSGQSQAEGDMSPVTGRLSVCLRGSRT